MRAARRQTTFENGVTISEGGPLFQPLRPLTDAERNGLLGSAFGVAAPIPSLDRMVLRAAGFVFAEGRQRALRKEWFALAFGEVRGFEPEYSARWKH